MVTPSAVLDASLPKGRGRHRTIIGIGLAATMFLTWMILAAMTTGLPLVGNIAWASDVDKKIADATKPIEQKVGQREQAAKGQTQLSTALLANITASYIRATYARLCAKPTPSETERDRLNGDLDRYLAEYPQYTDGRRFPVESLRCQP